MKKKVVLLLLVVVIAVMALAGCTYRVYGKYVSNLDELKVAMPNMKLPDLNAVDELKGAKFFDARAHKDDVSIDAKLMKNTIYIEYIPAIEKGSQKEADDFTYADINGEDKVAYRYSLTMMLDSFDEGSIEFAVFGTDYAKVKDAEDMKEIGKSPRTLAKRLEELKGVDKSFIEDKCDASGKVMKYSKKDNELYQVKRYFVTDDNNYSYELTCTIRLKDGVNKDTGYNTLVAKSESMLDTLVAGMMA